jgi:hypothetical protein
LIGVRIEEDRTLVIPVRKTRKTSQKKTDKNQFFHDIPPFRKFDS